MVNRIQKRKNAAQLEPALTETESAAYTSLTANAANTLAQSLLPLLTGTGQLSQTLGDAFNGLAEGQTGSVSFIFETEELKKD